MAFNAGSIQATLTLDRKAFSAGLKAAKAEADKFAKQRFEVKITPKLDRTSLQKIKADIEKVTGNINVKVKLDNSSLQAVKARIDRTVGNINVKVKLDNSSLQAVKQRIDRSVGNVNVKAKLDNSSLQAVKTRINSAVGNINVRVKLDTSSLSALKARVERGILRVNVRLDLDRSSLEAIKARVEALRLKIKVSLDLDRSDLTRLRAELAAFRPTVKVRLDFDRSALSQLNGAVRESGNAFSGAGSQARAFIALLPLILSVGAPVINGLIALLGGLGSAFAVVASGIGAFGLVAAGAFQKISQHAKQSADATKAMTSAYDQVSAARERLSQVIEQSAQQNEQAEKKVADAREQLSRTTEAAARADVEAEAKVADARKNLARVTDSVARDNVAAQERIAEARQNLSDTIESASRSDAQAEQRVADAEQNLADVIDAAARANEEAQKRIASAQKDVTKAVEDAARANASAADRVSSAERSLTRTQEDAKRAQEDLNQARKDAVEELENLKLSLRGAALDEEQATIDLQDAQERYNQALRDGTSGTELKQLELNIRKAKLAVDQSKESYQDLQQKSDEYAKTGIEGSKGVLDAQQKVADANQNVKDAEKDVADARSEATQTALDGQAKIVEAQQGVIDAQKEANQTALDGQKQVQKAQQDVAQAQQEATQTALDGQKSILKAQQDVVKAQEEAAQTAVDGQQKILDAQDEVAKAQKEAAQTAVDGQRDVLDAQKAVAEAEKEAAQVQLENQRQIKAATDDLVKAQRDYNAAAAEMPKALLPGYALAEAALNRLKDSYQALLDRTAPATGAALASVFDAGTKALGTLDPLVNATANSIERMGLKLQTYFGTKDWKNFVDFLAQHVGPTLDKVFEAAGHLADGIKGLVIAFQPLGDWLLDAINSGLKDFATWANGLASDPAFQKWLVDAKEDLKLLWQFLVEVVKFIIKLVKELEPLGRPIMQGLIAALDFLNGLPDGMLSAIAMGLSAIFAALILGGGGPVALGIGAVIAIGTALVTLYESSDTARQKMDGFVQWLKDVWNPIWTTVKDNFEKYIKPAFDNLTGAIRDNLWPALQNLGNAINTYVIPYLQPLADTLTKYVIPAFIDLLTQIVKLVSYLVDVFGPVFADIFGRLVGIADGALKMVAGVIETFIGLVTGDWQKFGDGLHTIAEGFWTAIAGLFGMTLDELKAKMHQWDEDIKSAWNGFWSDVSKGWNDFWGGVARITSDFIGTIEKRISEFGPYVSQRVKEAADGIDHAWRAVANFFRDPINWVINVVINDGILKSWNDVMGWIGAPALTAAPLAQLPAFAAGGEVTGPGTGTSDSVLARVSAGEYIVPASVAQANMGLLQSLPRFQTGGLVTTPLDPNAPLATGQAGATVAPGTTGTAQSQSWWSRVGANATALFNNILTKIPTMPGYASMIGQAIAGIPQALVKKTLEILQQKLTNIFPPAAPGAQQLDPAGNDPRIAAVVDRGGLLRPGTRAINTSAHAERVLSPTQTQNFDQLIAILNDMFHPTHTKSPTGGDIYHITLPKGASVKELANEIAFRKRVSAKGRYSPR